MVAFDTATEKSQLKLLLLPLSLSQPLLLEVDTLAEDDFADRRYHIFIIHKTLPMIKPSQRRHTIHQSKSHHFEKT